MPSFQNLGFPGYSHYIVVTAFNEYEYSFGTEFYIVSKNVMTHVDNLVPAVQGSPTGSLWPELK
jgi:hypothetical protein